jgi:hypothetical protein
LVHLQHGVTAAPPATAAPAGEATRRRVITAVRDLQSRPDVDAWLGAAVDRYSFGVELFHLLLHAGLPRRFPKINSGTAAPSGHSQPDRADP